MTAIDVHAATAVDHAPFTVHALDPDRMLRIREAGRDEFGNPLTARSALGWEPLRCCLRVAAPDEAIALICWTPWSGPSPWLEAGPVFVHLDTCEGYRESDEYPATFARLDGMLNPFHADGSRAYEHIRFVGPDDDHVAALRDVLASPEVDHLHVRSALAGCFVFAVERG